MELLSPHDSFDALIFDCDGTLVDTGPTHLAAYNMALRPLGVSIPDEYYRPRFGLAPQDLLRGFLSAHGISADVEPIIQNYSQVYQEDLSRLTEIRIVADVARRYQGTVPMAVASNGRRPNVERTLRAVGLHALFDTLVTIEDVAQGKPAPDIYLEAGRRLGATPAACLVFEDTDEGLTAARRAGMQARDVRPFLQ